MAIQREYLSPNEIAEYLGVSPFTIRRYIKLGELKAVKLLGGFRVHKNDLQGFLKAHEVNPADEQLEPEETTALEPVAALQPTLANPSPAPHQPAPPTAPLISPTVPILDTPPKRKRGRPRKNRE